MTDQQHTEETAYTQLVAAKLKNLATVCTFAYRITVLSVVAVMSRMSRAP